MQHIIGDDPLFLGGQKLTAARATALERGIDRLRDDYFGHYRRLVWLVQEPAAELRARRAGRRKVPPPAFDHGPRRRPRAERAPEDLLGQLSSG